MKRLLATFVLASLVAGCASSDVPMNPSFPLTIDEGWRQLHSMERSPRKLSRPVIVMGGYVDPGSAPEQTRRFIEACTGDKRTLAINTTFDFTFDAARRHLIEAIEKKFPSDDPNWTVEVDIVAHSMGGLIVRYAALDRSDPLSPAGGWERAGAGAESIASSGTTVNTSETKRPSPPHRKRLRLAHLYSISVPHRGTIVADLPFFDTRQHAMRRGSRVLQLLDSQLDHLPYKIIPYVRLGDTMIGSENAAPWGYDAWWVQNYTVDSPHFNSSNDPRILADVLRRLRDETPYTTWPPTPMPK
ncbi:MAG: hypothetical protein WD768_01305 [Phycisphaeraceae bacterium]